MIQGHQELGTPRLYLVPGFQDVPGIYCFFNKMAEHNAYAFFLRENL
jgi:hypothetical protein